MMRVNSVRLQSIVNNYIEVLSDLEEDSSLYINMDENDRYYKQVGNSFRNNMKEMYTVFEDYIAFSLSVVGVAVTENRLREYILKAYKLNIITENIYEYYHKTLNIRNTFSHQYKKPNTKSLLKLFKENRELFIGFTKFLDIQLEKQVKENNVSSIFEVKK